MIKAYAAREAGGRLEPFEYDPGELGQEQVEIDVQACGVCHSDLSMWENHWQIASYPFVPGHEVVGRVAAAGDRVQNVKVGDTVGLGWFAGSCMTCDHCMAGDHNLCASNEQTIVGRPGGFADKVRCKAEWATPLPEGVDPRKAGPLFCGGITVSNPIVQSAVQPTDRVGVIGIGGLGHMALQFLQAWGCEVTAFTSSDSKREQALEMGAHNVVNSSDGSHLDANRGLLELRPVHGERGPGLGPLLRHPGAPGPPARGGRDPLAGAGFRLPHDRGPEELLGLAPGLASHDPEDAGVLRPPRDRGRHRALP